MKRIVAGTLVALFGLFALLTMDKNPQGPTGDIIGGSVCITLGGILIFFGVRSRSRKRAERIRQGLPAAPALTLRDVIACIVAWVCGFIVVAFVGFLVQLFQLHKIGGLGGSIISMLVFVIAIGNGVGAGKGVYRLLRRKEVSSGETTQQTDAPQLLPSSQPPIIPLTPPDTFTFSCPHCSQHISTTSASVGSEGECPTCQSAITIPSPNGTNA